MAYKPFALNITRSFIVSVCLAFSLSHCASYPTVSNEQSQVKAEVEAPLAVSATNKMHIVNHTDRLLDNIRFKPCGAPVKSYTTLKSSLRPQEKVMLSVHEVCIDVIIEDTFQKAVFEQSDINVTHPLTLDIK